MPMLHRLAILALLAPGVFAAQKEPEKDSAGAQTSPAPAVEPASKDVDVADLMRQAAAGLDRMEAGVDDATAKALLEEVNDRIDVLRTRDPGNPSLGYLYGRVYALIGRQGDAIDHLRRFVETPEGRNEWKAYRILGDLFVGEFPRLAKANYEKAAALNPTEPALAYGLSLCAFRLGTTDEAIRLAQQAVSADGGKTVRYLAHLANVLQAAERWDDAIADAERALKVAVNAVGASPGVHRALLTADAQYQQIIAVFQARARQSGDVPAETYVRLAEYYRERAKLADRLALHDALAVLTAGVERTAPNTPSALLDRYAATLDEAGRSADAVAAYEKLLQADPANVNATKQLERLRARPALTPNGP